MSSSSPVPANFSWNSVETEVVRSVIRQNSHVKNNKLADLVLTALKKASEDGKAVRYPIPLEKVKNKINNEKTSMSRGNSLTSFLGLDDNVATSSGSGSVSRDDSSGTNLKKRPRSYVEDDDEDDDDPNSMSARLLQLRLAVAHLWILHLPNYPPCSHGKSLPLRHLIHPVVRQRLCPLLAPFFRALELPFCMIARTMKTTFPTACPILPTTIPPYLDRKLWTLPLPTTFNMFEADCQLRWWFSLNTESVSALSCSLCPLLTVTPSSLR